MVEDAWSHLQDVVDAFMAVGNSVQPPGFRPTQGGWVCEMTGPLDPDVVAAWVETDSRLTYQDDELSCSHCWSVIIGARPDRRTGQARS